MNAMCGLVIWGLVVAAGVGCSDDDTGGDLADTSVAETSVTETSATETSVTETSVTETSVAETSVTETSVIETSVTEISDDTAGDTTDTFVDDVPSETADADDGTVIGESAQLVAAGFGFGECLTSCRGTVLFEGASLSFQMQDIQGAVEHAAEGMLTTGGAAEVQALVADLYDVPLRMVYGCPDCNDGGSRFLTFTMGESLFTTTYEYANPPAALAPLTTFVSGVMDALGSCTGDERVLIQGQCPLPER